MSAITLEQQQAIADFIANRTIVAGIGSKDAACSIASINLALSGRLTDAIPECMSQVIGQWIIRIQDTMPEDMRNSPEWRRLLPLAAGTGRKHEAKRLAIILDHMWAVTLPLAQPLADANGFGAEWRRMCEERTEATAEAAEEAASAAASAAACAAAASAAACAAAAERAAATAGAAAEERWAEASAVSEATWAAASAAASAAAADAWPAINPTALLAKLIEVSE